MTTRHYPDTPDGRNFVVRGRLWRKANPALPQVEHKRLVVELMTARRAVTAARRNDDGEAESAAHADVDRGKRALGERGPAWWGDGAPDLNRLRRGAVWSNADGDLVPLEPVASNAESV